ncbi:hypothetical protein [Cognatiyoonia koreensis]|nr:hypothetical protein [Cognatiyoonia koreensis]
MVESSKILTVSYGTFSCTLEGFEDSFGTMKAIAEYFRDLAQGDRYFGAEPPAPDAEMLTRIAEKEIARRVEARADESGIVLRAVDAAQAPAAAPAMPPVATPPTEVKVAAVATAAVADHVESTHAATADADGDVARPEAGEVTAPTLVASSPAAADADDALDDDMAEEMDVTAPAASFAEMDAGQISEVPAHPDADSVAAKLQRIRAVVGPAAADDDMLEDEQTESFADDAEEEIADMPPASDDFAAFAAEDSFDEEDENDFAADLDNIDTEAQDDESADDDIAEAEEDEAELADDSTGEDDDAEADAMEDDSDADVAADADIDDDSAAESFDQDDAAEADEAEAEVAEDAEPAVEAPKQNFRARILRVAKIPALSAQADEADDLSEDTADAVRESIAAQSGDDVVAEADGAYDDIDDADVAELADIDEPSEATLSDEDEAELLADLAEVEREIEETSEAPAAEAAPEAPATPTGRDILPEADDAAMSRIMDQADEQLSEPEGSRRRSAIAQLKAAVAATEAARQLGDKGEDQASKENAFRDDLNQAVRPRSGDELPRTQLRTERPRPAPLKLVPAQRVDEADTADSDAAPVLPRRVASDAGMVDAGNFADFAAEMGATELPDLLEAAAAYTAYVEGVEDFSRPQIMKKVQASATEEFSREDGLRSFGTLLRQGRISKVRNGRFQVSDQTRFKPEKKAG